MTLETLDKLNDDELQECANRACEILSQRQETRRLQAIEKARRILAEVGTSFDDLANRKKSAPKGHIYRAGHRYQHPQEKELVWNATGQKPNWLRKLEKEGGKAVELMPAPVKVNGKTHDEK